MLGVEDALGNFLQSLLARVKSFEGVFKWANSNKNVIKMCRHCGVSSYPSQSACLLSGDGSCADGWFHCWHGSRKQAEGLGTSRSSSMQQLQEICSTTCEWE